MTYKKYIEKLHQSYESNMNEKPVEWIVSKKLADKVRPDGHMNDFFGTTTVIKLSERDKAACTAIQAKMMERTGDMLAMLNPDTFHLTIHSLSNMSTVSRNINEIRSSIEAHDSKIKAEIRCIYDQYRDASIRMRSLGPSTTGNEAISIKFIPCSERDYELLMDLHRRIDAIFSLPNFFIPHVSLAYFKLIQYSPEQIEVLYDVMHELHEFRFDIELAVDQFVYQYHYTMNDYKDIDI